ncbi:uncharacterized protein CTRU02_205905 [Colletotrichum truncatum]|uniref:Uncharacterized protein n=1 Tax=Colletotrichum truncatum TaxID=5467 RepID=A0ACC3Z5F5_COLTU|nr:uncharacterized protein CTRU02_04738 [Colletotrichum truncatum]KAF6795175.1 hypothetical protein CTRU02_04738 [Colletotrichum truncatum]
MRFTSIFAVLAASVVAAQSQSSDETTTTLTQTTTKTITITKCNPTNTACPLYTPTSTILPTINSTTTTSTSPSSSSSSSSSSSHYYPASNSTTFAGPTASAPWTKSSVVPIKTSAGSPGAPAASVSTAPNAGSGIYVQSGLLAAVVGLAMALN